MKLRAGYIYDLTPVPDSTFDPQVPDANRHIFTVGSDLKVSRDSPWGSPTIISWPRAAPKTTAFPSTGFRPLQANGRYNSDVHSLGLSWLFQF